MNINERWNNHKRLLNNNKHFNIHLQRAWNLYGAESFKFLIHKTFDSDDEEQNLKDVQTLEQDMIDMFYKTGLMYNRSTSSKTGALKGEDHPNYNKSPSEWMSEDGWKRTLDFHKNRDISGEKNPFYGKTHSDETKKILSEKCANYGENNGFYGKKHTEETLKIMSEKKKDLYNGEKNPFYGKQHTEESKKIMAETARSTFSGVPKREDQKEKMRKSSPFSKKVKIDGIIYSSCSEASRITGEDRRRISYRANSKSFPNYEYITN